MPKSTPTCNSILALMYNATAWANVADNASSAPFSNVYVALHTASLTPGTNSQLENEVAYTDYGRIAKARSTSGWTVPSSGATKNEGLIQYTQCGVTGATAQYVSTGTALSGAGTVWHYGSLNSPLVISSGITPIFADDSLTITET